MTRPVSVASTQSKFQQQIAVGPHHLEGDEDTELGGMDVGPSPEELILSALGTCINITLQMYASRKQWPLPHVAVRLWYAKVPQLGQFAGGVATMVHRVDVALALPGGLSEPQRQRLYEISQRCPVHRMLAPGMDIHSQLLPAGADLSGFLVTPSGPRLPSAQERPDAT